MGLHSRMRNCIILLLVATTQGGSLPDKNRCADPPAAQCGTDQMVCYNGYNADGCSMGSHCVNYDDPCGCPPPAVQCGTDQVVCDMGTWDGCPVGNYCLNTDDLCGCPPPYAQCGSDEVLCDNGSNADGCWMGNFCIASGDNCPEAAGK